MNKISGIVILGIVAILPFGVSAKESIGDYVLEFDQKIEADTDNDGENDRFSYYRGEILVWTAYDNDGDGRPDLWLRYKNGDTVDLEIYDSDGDGEPEKITEFDAQERAEVIYDSEIIDSSAGGISYWVYILGAAVLLAGWYYLKLRKSGSSA